MQSTGTACGASTPARSHNCGATARARPVAKSAATGFIQGARPGSGRPGRHPPRSGHMQAVLALDQISKSFPGVRALDGVGFDVRAGEVHALLGENGAGKSTLIKIISGLYQPDEGTIRLDGEMVRFANPHDAQRRGIATIFQELLLFPELTVAENIFMGHAPRTRFGGIDWSAMRAKARALLASLDIHDLDPSRLVGSLSVGNRQRVEIAKALSQDARILIMDEPTAALTEADVAAPVRHRPPAARARRRHRLHQPSPRGGFRARRPGHRAARRRLCRDPRRCRGERGRSGQHDGRPQDREPVSRSSRRRSAGRCSRSAASRSIRAFHDVDLVLRAGEVVGFAGLVGSGRSELAQAIFGLRPPDRGEVLIDGRQVRITSPGQAKRLGIAYVPEDRGSQGLIRPMTLRENISLAVLRQVAPAWFIDRARRGGTRRAQRRAVPHPRQQRRAGRREALRRQPAEGGARQVARDEAARPDHGRADARHRHRRQVRDPPPDERARAAGPGDPDDLERAARDHGHERSHPGDARRHDRRRPSRAARRPRR